jgi:acyl-CoA thioesterase-2
MTEHMAASWDGSDLADLLDLAPIAADRFRSRVGERNEHGRIYGGQLLGQAVAAAARTVLADRPVSYLQFLFAAGGLPEQAIDFEVSSIQEGKRFSSRHVRGTQAGGRILCDASVSFARPIESPAHAAAPAADSGFSSDPERLPRLQDVDAPEAREVERTLNYAFHEHPAIDLRLPFVHDFLRGALPEPRARFWMRVREPLRDDPTLQAAAFAYISDYWINAVACIPHARAMSEAGAKLYVASLNHAIWFHRPLRADQWLLFDCVSPSGALGRGLAIARIFSRSGEMVASATQECLLAPSG